jgi:putative ABC transport system permease protein
VSIVSVRAGDVAQDTFSGVVTPGYFDRMEIPIVRGRAFGDADRSASGAVAIVNEAFVRKWWAGREPLGQSVDVVFYDKHVETRQIVGVVRDTRSGGGDTRARAEIYFPLAQSATPFLHFIVQTARPGDPRLASAIRATVSATDATQVIDRIAPMQELLDGRVSTWRLGAWLLGVFAAIAILLTAVGLAASIAWWVTQRTREIGVRMALGANPRDVWRMVLAQGVGLAMAGVILGLAGAAASTRLIASWLYGVTPLDPKTFAASAAGMVLIAAIASYIPARRATRIDPLVALRES